MKENLILPLASSQSQEDDYKTDVELSLKVSEWLNTRAEFMHEVWSQTSSKQETDFSNDSTEIAEQLVKILTHRVFNYQSKSNLSKIISEVRQNLERQINNGKTIKFFLLYNGGYRASSDLNQLDLIFEPDQTELLLLYQIALLSDKIRALYAHGIEFFIVINNGVAKWVNDIPIIHTENYANQLREMIAFFGAEKNIKVLLQSELVCLEQDFPLESFPSETLLSEEDHLIVERFLGRKCSKDEAEYRIGLYKLAEEKWAEELTSIVASKDGIIMRQVAHPDMLSFRPFPGGAIRTQNGTVGFHHDKNVLIPKLITSKSTINFDVKRISCHFPWRNDVNDNVFYTNEVSNV